MIYSLFFIFFEDRQHYSMTSSYLEFLFSLVVTGPEKMFFVCRVYIQDWNINTLKFKQGKFQEMKQKNPL